MTNDESYLRNPSIAASHASPIPTPVLNLQTPMNLHTPVNSQTPVPTLLTTQSTSRVPVASASVLQKQSKHSMAASAYHVAPTTYQTVEHTQQRNGSPIVINNNNNSNNSNVSPTPFQVISSSYAANAAASSGSPYRASSTPFFGTSQFQHFTSQTLSPTQQSVPFHTSLSPSGMHSKSFDTDEPSSHSAAVAAAAAAVVAAAAKTSSFVKQQLHQYPPGTVSSNKLYRESSRSTAAAPVLVQPTISSAVPRPQSQTPVSLGSFNKFARSYPVRSSQHQPPSLASTPAELARILPPQSPQSVQSSPDITAEHRDSRSTSGSPSSDVYSSDPQFRPQFVLDSISNTKKWKDNFEQYRVRQYDIYHITIKGPINELELIPVRNNEFNVVVN